MQSRSATVQDAWGDAKPLRIEVDLPTPVDPASAKALADPQA